MILKKNTKTTINKLIVTIDLVARRIRLIDCSTVRMLVHPSNWRFEVIFIKTKTRRERR